MAQNATIYKAELQIANLDQHYYANHNLTIARHPSENEQRMMVRVLAFIVHASEHLSFCKGISTDNEPDLWQRSLTDDIELWIELGQIDEKRLKKACNKSSHVKLYCYGPSVETWWSQSQSALNKYPKLTVEQFTTTTTDALTKLLSRTMDFQCSIQDNQLWLSSGNETLLIETTTLKALV